MRWLNQGRADLQAARDSMEARHFEWAAFQAQQADEKALKAIWILVDADPWGHSLTRLVREFPDASKLAFVGQLLEAAKLLDKLYIPTRYPNGLPDLTPAEVFTRQEAEQAIAAAEHIIRQVAAAWER